MCYRIVTRQVTFPIDLLLSIMTPTIYPPTPTKLVFLYNFIVYDTSLFWFLLFWSLYFRFTTIRRPRLPLMHSTDDPFAQSKTSPQHPPSRRSSYHCSAPTLSYAPSLPHHCVYSLSCTPKGRTEAQEEESTSENKTSPCKSTCVARTY
jgi:hypothetical protein